MGGRTGASHAGRGWRWSGSIGICCVLISAALAACTGGAPAPLPTADGRAVVLGPAPGFDPAAPPRDWFVLSDTDEQTFSIAEISGVRVLRIAAPGGPLVGRRLAMPILAAPYIHIGWYVDPVLYSAGPGDGLPRGIRLVIGFKGGTPGGPQLLDRVFGVASGAYPPHDRVIELRLGGIGATRSEDAIIEMVAVNDRGIRRVLRQGTFGQAGRWHIDAIDLAALYGMFWPHDRRGRVEIGFIAVGGLRHQIPAALADGAKNPTIGYVAEILLTR